MLYLFYGTESFLIKKEIDKIKEQNHIESLNEIQYDLEETSLSVLLEDAAMLSLFGDKKLIVVNNAYLFTSTPNKKVTDDEIKLLEKYIDNLNPKTILVFTVLKDKLDERKKIVKKTKENATVKDFNKIEDITIYIKNALASYDIKTDVIRFLIDRVGSNIGRINNELDKIKLYKEDKVITKEDIVNLTSKNIDVDIFELVDSIIIRNKDKAISIYKEMLKRNEEPIKIMIMLANQFRLIYQAKELFKKGYTQNDIAKILDIHPYRIKLALEKGYSYNSAGLLTYLNDLAMMDIDIKSGNINPDISLELFILRL